MKGMAVLSSPGAYQESHAGDDRRSGIIVFNVVCYALSVVAVLLRVVSRSLAKVETRADDWWIWGVLVCHICSQPVNLWGLVTNHSSARLHYLHLYLPSPGPFWVGKTRITRHQHERICIGKSRCPRANT